MYNRLYSNDRSHERRKDVKDMVADPYQVLGVSHSATEDEIRQAYRRLAPSCKEISSGSEPRRRAGRTEDE